MKYCKSCRRFVAQEKDICSFCGSSEFKALSFAENDSEAVTGTCLPGEEIIFNSRVFRVRKTIGLGGYGVILEVEEDSCREIFAMKVPLTFEHYFGAGSNYSIRELESSEKSIKDEIEVLEKIDTDRIINVHSRGEAVCIINKSKKTFPAILMELAVCTLRDIILLEASGKIEISLAEKLEMASQIVSTIADLHRAGIIHRDIALENIFVVNRGGEIKYVMADFGTSREGIRKSTEKTTGVIGRDKYLDPLRFDKRYRRDPRVDIFTAGIVITEIFIGNLWDNIIFEPLYDIDFEREFLKSYAAGQIDGRLVKFISKALKTDISKRYKDASEMKKKLENTISRIIRSAGVRKFVRTVDLIYNIPFPPEIDSPEKDSFIHFENHKKISLDINLRTVIVFRNGKINNVSLKQTPFFRTYCEGNNVYIVPDRKRLEKEFRFFRRKKFSGDRGILYFTGKLKIESRSIVLDTITGGQD
ncbi:MAG: protein kinase [Candidatus Aminicenantes bacterium]|nr:protein kinase [Candidatus Aminicenantes bacterium]MCK5003536.1 protein kinase [Candidatus Aminicenantes bacterium]